MGQESAHSPSSNRGKLTSKILAVCRRPQPSCQRYRVMIESQGTTTLDPGQWQRRRSGFGRPALRSVILKTNAKVCGAGSDPVRTQRHLTHLPLRRAWHPRKTSLLREAGSGRSCSGRDWLAFTAFVGT